MQEILANAGRQVRDRQLTPEEIAEDRRIREQVQQELPELIARHQERIEARTGKTS